MSLQCEHVQNPLNRKFMPYKTLEIAFSSDGAFQYLVCIFHRLSPVPGTWTLNSGENYCKLHLYFIHVLSVKIKFKLRGFNLIWFIILTFLTLVWVIIPVFRVWQNCLNVVIRMLSYFGKLVYVFPLWRYGEVDPWLVCHGNLLQVRSFANCLICCVPPTLQCCQLIMSHSNFSYILKVPFENYSEEGIIYVWIGRSVILLWECCQSGTKIGHCKRVKMALKGCPLIDYSVDFQCHTVNFVPPHSSCIHDHLPKHKVVSTHLCPTGLVAQSVEK